jgi:hypothetical protein
VLRDGAEVVEPVSGETASDLGLLSVAPSLITFKDTDDPK